MPNITVLGASYVDNNNALARGINSVIGDTVTLRGDAGKSLRVWTRTQIPGPGSLAGQTAVVLELGGNGVPPASDILVAVEKLRVTGAARVVWFAFTDWPSTTNGIRDRRVETAARIAANVSEFFALPTPDPSVVRSDGVHLTPTGYQALGAAIAQALGSGYASPQNNPGPANRAPTPRRTDNAEPRRTVPTPDAIPATPELASPESLAEQEANSFATIYDRYGRQRAVQANEDVPSDDPPPELHLSDYGYSALPLPAGARFLRFTGPNMQSVDRTEATLEGQKVDQLILHAAGWSEDRETIADRQAGAPVEAGTGYSPTKVAAILQQYLSGRRQAPHCFVTRRGDIYCLLPWSKATKLSSPSGNTADIQDRSITVALEMRYTTSIVPYAEWPQNPTITLPDPITPAQRTAIAFIARKLMTWAGLTELPALTGSKSDMEPRIGTGGSHTAGMLSYASYDYGRPEQQVPELLLPPDWTLGAVATLPEYLRRDDVLEAWTRRIETVYPALNISAGTVVAPWQAIASAIGQLEAYRFDTQLFAPPETARVFEAAPPAHPIIASNTNVIVHTGQGYQRARDMSSAIRSSIYDAASVALDATVIATLEAEARNRATERGITHVAVALDALGFNFETGTWEHQTVQVFPGDGSINVTARNPIQSADPD